MTSARDGALLAAADGRVLAEGGGLPLELRVEERPARPSERIHGPIEIESVDGRDVVEAVDITQEPIAIPVRYEGEGPVIALSDFGAVGRRRIARGVVSGQVISMEVIEEPLPMVLARSRPAVNDRIVALTFDDGPWPGQTQEILDILEREDVHATFFMLGVQVRRNPEIARAVRDAGHTIGNHTYGHSILRRATKQQVRKEIEACRDAVRRATGVTPVFFRPPGGLLSPSVYEVCREKDMPVVGWTVDPQDWSGKDTDALVEDVIDHVEPGAVVLLHDGGGDRTSTIEALPQIIAILRARGFTFVTLEDVPALAVTP